MSNNKRSQRSSKSATSQPSSLDRVFGAAKPQQNKSDHSSLHSHPVPAVPGSKIPVFVGQNNNINPLREKSRSESPQRRPDPSTDQRSPEEDSSLFNISNISTASSGSCSNSSYSISGTAPPVVEISPCDDKQPGYR